VTRAQSGWIILRSAVATSVAMVILGPVLTLVLLFVGLAAMLAIKAHHGSL